MAGMTAAAFSLPSRFWAELTTRDFAQLQASPWPRRPGRAARGRHRAARAAFALSVDATLLQGVIDAAPAPVAVSPCRALFPAAAGWWA